MSIASEQNRALAALEAAYETALLLRAVGRDYQQQNGNASTRAYRQEVKRLQRQLQDQLLAFRQLSPGLLAELSRNPELRATVDRKLQLAESLLQRPLGQLTRALPAPRPPAPVESPMPFRSLRDEFDGTDATAANGGPAREPVQVLPRSIFGTFDRLRRDIDPRSEEEVVESFRARKTQTMGALRFIILLVLVPLLTQQISKTFIVGPIVDQLRTTDAGEVFLNVDLEEEAFKELRHFEERLQFQRFLAKAPPLQGAELEKELREKVDELAEEARAEGANAIKNVFSDLAAVIAVAVLLVTSRREVALLKGFIDDFLYGISDSAKAFVIILFTDMFVGFHSPHGWEVLLTGTAHHFGLPVNEAYNNMFIATFPVILDTVFKYWIFRYLNRVSPSAVATMRSMNE